jgi:hypothetical protein
LISFSASAFVSLSSCVPSVHHLSSPYITQWSPLLVRTSTYTLL